MSDPISKERLAELIVLADSEYDIETRAALRELETARARIHTLEQDLSYAQEDVRRYRWLRELLSGAGLFVHGIHLDNTIDEAIDAALAASPKEPKP